MKLAGPANMIDLAAWKALVAKGEPPAAAVLRKQYIADTVKAEGGADSREVGFTISTGAIDRDRDTVSVDGWDLDNYRKNPVVLFGHNYRDLPVARAVMIGTGAGVLKARAEFATLDLYAFADTVLRMLKGGFLRAVSVGFKPKTWAYDEERRGYDILTAELLEFSVVPVPANPDALMDAKAAGIDLKPLKAACERILDGLEDEPGIWLPRAKALEVFDRLKTPAVAFQTVRVGDVEVSEPVALGKALTALFAFRKAGRVLSKENEERIRSARANGDQLCSTLDAVLAQVEAQEETSETGEGGKTVKAATPPPAPEPLFIPTEESMRTGIASVLSEVATSQVNRALGRLD